MAIDALKEGVYDYIEKPILRDSLIQSVRRAWSSLRLELENIGVIYLSGKVSIEMA